MHHIEQCKKNLRGIGKIIETKYIPIYFLDFLATNNGNIRVASCSNCAIAWLYKDAHKFGLQTYQELVGNYNILCPRTNSGAAVAVLDNHNPDFIDLMESCPDTGIQYQDILESNQCKKSSVQLLSLTDSHP